MLWQPEERLDACSALLTTQTLCRVVVESAGPTLGPGFQCPDMVALLFPTTFVFFMATVCCTSRWHLGAPCISSKLQL